MRFLHVFYLFLLAATVRLAVVFPILHITTFPIQKYDAYIYVLKALEITRGNWLPIHTHGIGLPAFLAPFLYLWGGQSIFEHFLIGVLVTAVTGAAIVFPLAWLSYKLTRSKEASLGAIIMFIFAFPIIIPDNLFIFTESLFTLIFITSLCLIYKGCDNAAFAYSASAVAGLGYWVRPNGIMILPILVVSFLISCKAGRWRALGTAFLMIAVFFAVSGPMLYMRHAQFGSAFDYGENSKYFVERYVDVWGAAPSVSIGNYLASHTAGDIFNRFFIAGTLLALIYFAYVLLPGIFFFLYGVVVTWRDPLWFPIWTGIGIWIASLTPIFYLYYLTRHLFPIAPLGIIMSAAGVKAMIASRPESKKMVLSIFAASQAVILCVSISVFLFSARRFTKDVSRVTADSLVWARWAAAHVRGVLAIGNGMNIMMLLPDTEVGGVGMLDLYAPKSRLRITYPGKFDSLEEAMPIMRMRKVTHIALEDDVQNPIPFVPNKYLSIYDGERIPPYLKEIYSNYGTNSQSKARIFSIDWKEYARLQ